MRVVFDSSSLISVSQSCLVNVLGSLKEKLGAEFIIPEAVYREAVERPISIKRFELNAIRIKKGVEEGWFSVKGVKDEQLMGEIDGLANSCFSVRGRPVRLLQLGEVEALALIKELGADALVIDERTTRMLIENPKQLKKIMEARRRKNVRVEERQAKDFGKMFEGTAIARSIELVALSHEFGLLEQELPKGRQSLEAALFALKYSGCAVSSREINLFLQGK
jgi:predicted nucleic acid-binding protein